MLRSMNSAIAGLKNHQIFMDVIGNNIANVNTTAFKGSRVDFQTMLSQTIRGSVAPAAGRGGINAAQIGLGSQLAAIDVLNTQGGLNTTGKATDLAIQGDGFFVMTDGFRNFYTRDGDFDLSGTGELISPATGLKVLGWGTTLDAQGNTIINNKVPPAGGISVPLGQLVTAKPSTNLQFNGNLNGAPTDLVGTGSVESTLNDGTLGFNVAAGDTITFTYNGQIHTATLPNAYTKDAGSITALATDITTAMNNAILADTGTAGDISVTVNDTATLTGEASLQFQGSKALKFANTPSTNTGLDGALKNRQSEGLQSVLNSIRVFDSLGNKHDISLRFDKQPLINATTGATQPDLWKWTITNLDAGMTIDATNPHGVGTGFLQMGSDGKFQSVNTTDATGAVMPGPGASLAQVTFNYANGANSGQTVTLDFSQLTEMQDGNTAAVLRNDGYETGTLLSFSIGQDGVMTGSYSNGQNQVLGQIALATFPNVGGLTHVSQNLFAESVNSGGVQIGVANEGARGSINAGQLELSNVDLATQFTDMIRAERGFQANSRIITTSDEMLQDLVNLKR